MRLGVGGENAVDIRGDPRSAVGEDVIAADRVARAGGGVDAQAAVEGDNVTGPRCGAADRLIAREVGRAEDVEAVSGVAQVFGPAHVGADFVALHDVPWRIAIGLHGDAHAVASVGGDHVARPDDGSPDQIARKGRRDAVATVAQRLRAGPVRADKVAPHDH